MYYKMLLLYYKEHLLVKNTGKNTLQYCYTVNNTCLENYMLSPKFMSYFF